MAGRLQNEDFKTEAELVAAGADKTHLLGDTKVYVTANGINNTLYNAIVAGTIGGGGGGGGGNFAWRNIGLPAPNETIEYNRFIYKFMFNSGGQTLGVSFRVPSSYTVGNPISLDLDIYSPSTSGTNLLLMDLFYFASGSAANSPTATRTSTNTVVTLSAPANKITKITLDVTDSLGKISGNSVQPNEEIVIYLYRGTDSDTADIRMIPDAAQVRLK
jgi:hypothetical protein